MIQSRSHWTDTGVYTPDQAARLLDVRVDMVERWVYGYGRRSAAIIPEQRQLRGKLVTFLDFVQVMAVKAIREQKRVSLQKIRKTVLAARKYGIQFPFARKHRTYVFSDDVVLRLDDGTLIQVTGKYSDNALLEPIVYDYLDDLGFDDQGLANLYVPLRRAHRSVRLTPSLNYGAPTVHPCGYTVATLIDACAAEGGIDKAADVCGVNFLDVKLAIEYEEKLAA
jgi:uncharacterized protein (DUF433 family)